MSRQSSFINQLREVPTGGSWKVANQITLIDTENKSSYPPSADLTDTEEGPSTRPEISRPPTDASLLKSLTNTSFREQARKQRASYRYGKYRRDRYEEAELEPSDDLPTALVAEEGEPAVPTQKGYLERGRAKAAKARQMLKRKRTLHKASDEDSYIDILYENQRGAFLFGIPKFSSSSLLNFDPMPWQNAQFRTSPVDIRNAQVPDPSWEWAWKNWYVDMSRDVDEQGWEYSFMFQKRFNWHGNHPWFHSFVRRRRWLRKRVRKDIHKHQTKEKAHELNADYFTIHPKTLRSTGREGSLMSGTVAQIKELAKLENDINVDEFEISNIADLMHALRKASVDREKLVAVRKFIESGSDEVYYLASSMEDIMSLFVFQSSRRHLLAELLHHFDGAKSRKNSLAAHTHEGDDEAQAEHEKAERNAQNLLDAVKAADEEVKKLEYWSDIKDMTRKGDTLHATDEDKWDPEKWQGLDPSSQPKHRLDSFRSKQKASEGVKNLHPHPEHEEGEDCDDTADDSEGPSSEKKKKGNEPSAEDHGYEAQKIVPDDDQEDKDKNVAVRMDSDDNTVDAYELAHEELPDSDDKKVESSNSKAQYTMQLSSMEKVDPQVAKAGAEDEGEEVSGRVEPQSKDEKAAS